jgi:hypothetical protein
MVVKKDSKPSFERPMHLKILTTYSKPNGQIYLTTTKKTSRAQFYFCNIGNVIISSPRSEDTEVGQVRNGYIFLDVPEKGMSTSAE